MSAREEDDDEENTRLCSLKSLRSALVHVGLLFLCCAYIVLGAVVFRALETPIEQQLRQQTLTRLQHIQKVLLDDVIVNARKGDRAEFFLDRLDNYTLHLFDIFETAHGAHVFETHFAEPAREKEMWTLSSAVLFTATTVIPVGYGYVTPVSSFSRLLVVIYGMIGIPLALVTMADAGKFLSNFVTQCFTESLTVPTVIFLSLLMFYPILGGLLFHFLAGMTLLDAIYFSLTSIFTIGFGDLTPEVNVLHLVLFIVFGVILVTITIDFVAAELIDHIHYMGRHVGRAKEIAGKMFSLAQSLNMNRGLTVGMTQLHALARFGLLSKLDQNALKAPRVHVAFEPSLDDMDFMDCGVSRDFRSSRLSLYNI